MSISSGDQRHLRSVEFRRSKLKFAFDRPYRVADGQGPGLLHSEIANILSVVVQAEAVAAAAMNRPAPQFRRQA